MTNFKNFTRPQNNIYYFFKFGFYKILNREKFFYSFYKNSINYRVQSSEMVFYWRNLTDLSPFSIATNLFEKNKDAKKRF